MNSTHLIGVVYALISAILYGGGDFSGGVASRERNYFHVLAYSSISSVLVLIFLSFVYNQDIPHGKGLIYAALAGLTGSFGTVALYRALSLANAAIVAPTVGVIGTCLPVVFSSFTEGLPRNLQILGFVLALCGIWFVNESSYKARLLTKKTLLITVVGGICFGVFFIFIAHVEQNTLLPSLIVVKIMSLIVAFIGLTNKKSSSFSYNSFFISVLAGILYTGANVFFIFAKEYTRLDIVAVVASFYPMATVGLACVFFKEKILIKNWVGIVFCLASITLII